MAASHHARSDGRKSTNHDIPLVPFIDLLLCCVMFLLATAVWAELSRLAATPEGKAPDDVVTAAAPEPWRLIVEPAQIVLQRPDHPPLALDAAPGQDLAQLREVLGHTRPRVASETPMVVQPGDRVPYARVIRAMDTAASAGFRQLVMGS